MTAKVFLDTNLWIYFFLKDPDDKYQRVAELVTAHASNASLLVSTQVLGEIYNVLTRKIQYSKQRSQEVIRDLEEAFSPIIPIDTATVFKALEISDRYSYSYWDSLILAAAHLNNCKTLYSEDLQHNQVIFEHLNIRNPFIVNQ